MKIEHLKQLKDAQRENRRNLEELAREFRSLSKEEREEAFGSGLWWAWAYELSIVQHYAVVYWSMGQLERLLSVLASGGDPLQALIEYASGFDPDVEGSMTLFEGEEGKARKAIFMSAFLAVTRQVECVEREGCYLSDLVQRTRDGDDVAFLKALRIDRTVISCPTFGERVTRAEMEGDAEFFKNLARAMGKKWSKKSPKGGERHKDLRLMLQAAHETGTLGNMTVTDLDKLFIKELGVYSDEGEDPVRGLQKFIYRWKNNR